MCKILTLNGFKNIKIITPGMLDFDIINKNQKVCEGSSYEKILQILNNKKINSSDIKKIQKTIYLNNLSSHMLVMAKKEMMRKNQCCNCWIWCCGKKKI